MNYNKVFLGLCLSTSLSVCALPTDLTAPNASQITVSGENQPYEGKTSVFDNNVYSKWLTFASTGWVEYQFNAKSEIKTYTITSANDAPSRDPKSWIVEGSNDGVNWVILDQQFDQSFSQRYQKKSYQLSSSQQFDRIRLDITNNHGANILQIAEVEFIGEESNTSPNTLPFSASANLTQGQWQHYGPFSSTNKIIASTTGTGDADLYLRSGNQPSEQWFDCKSTSPDANERCELTGNNLYVSVHAYSQTQYQLTIEEETTPPSGDWVKPVVDFVDLNPQTNGSKLLKRIISDPAAHMANRCIDVAKILFKDPKESLRFKNLRFELRAKDHWGNEFVAYKMGQDGSGEMTIVVSTTHLSNIYAKNGNSDSAIRDEIDGILFHEVTHGYNNSPLTHDNYGDGKAFWAYTEGLADAVRIGAGFHKTQSPDIYNSSKWLGGYTTTGFFLHYVRMTHEPEFIYKFNKSAKDLGNYTWSFDAAFQQILGRGVDDLWNEYVQFIQNGGQLQY